MRSSDPGQDVRLLRRLGYATMAAGFGLIVAAAVLSRLGLAPVGLALTLLGVSVHSISRGVEIRENAE